MRSKRYLTTTVWLALAIIAVAWLRFSSKVGARSAEAAGPVAPKAISAPVVPYADSNSQASSSADAGLVALKGNEAPVEPNLVGKSTAASSASGVAGADLALAVRNNNGVQAGSADVAVIYNEAEAFNGQGRFAEAVAAYEKAALLQPDLAETYLRLGLLYFKLNLVDKAGDSYQKAIGHGMDNAEVYFHLGYIEEVKGALDKALENYLLSEKKGSGNPELFYNIGNAYARMDKGMEALAYYKRAVSMNPQHMDAFINLSTVSFKLNNFADAGFYLDKAVALGYKAPEEYLKVLASHQAGK
ncbi:MAG: tetratricopeptide repeat protein [Candidatus Omnitrophica bacterium]|nr:tetratricopeptide repeat protein [Candidatus Omnitrophota bacterium]